MNWLQAILAGGVFGACLGLALAYLAVRLKGGSE